MMILTKETGVGMKTATMILISLRKKATDLLPLAAEKKHLQKRQLNVEVIRNDFAGTISTVLFIHFIK